MVNFYQNLSASFLYGSMELSTQRLPFMFFILFSQASYKNNKIIDTGDYLDVPPDSQNLHYEKCIAINKKNCFTSHVFLSSAPRYTKACI